MRQIFYYLRTCLNFLRDKKVTHFDFSKRYQWKIDNNCSLKKNLNYFRILQLTFSDTMYLSGDFESVVSFTQT